MVKCTICEQRPANGGSYCAPCDNKLEAERKSKATIKPQKYLTYRGHVVGLYPNGNGRLTARLLTRSAEGLPKTQTLDLNKWCEGYSREIIKRFKACVLKLAHA